MKAGAALAHVGAILILIGAVLSWLTADYGHIHLRAAAGYAATWRGADGTVLPLPFGLRLDSLDAASPFTPAVLSVLDGDAAPQAHTLAANSSFSFGSYTFVLRGPDADGRGAWLGVASDPWGKTAVYCGYALVVAALAWCWIARKGRRRSACKHDRRLAALALAAAVPALACLIWKWVVSGCFPATGMPDTLMLASLVTALTGVALAAHSRAAVFVAVVLAFVALALAFVTGFGNDAFSPVLANPLLGIHVGLVIVAYALFSVITVCAAISLFRPDATHWAALEMRLLYPALLCLAAGIAVGSVWAAGSWGRFWGWDPKETSALVCMAVYLLPLHRALIRPLRRPRVLSCYLLVAYAFIIFTWFGVGRLFGGMHAYA